MELGGQKARGESVRRRVETVAEDAGGGTVPDSGHFVPEERPDEIVRRVLAMTAGPTNDCACAVPVTTGPQRMSDG